MLKDYGLLLYNQTKDLSEKPQFVFMNFVLPNLARVQPNLYSVSSRTEVDGEEYAMSIDFDKDILDNMLAMLPVYISDQMRQVLKGEDNYPIFIDLSQNPGDPITMDIRTKIGELQQGEDEDFISMIVTEVLEPEA
jgi:hypothetical protein